MSEFSKKALALSEIDTFVKPWKVIQVTFVVLILLLIILSPHAYHSNIEADIERLSISSEIDTVMFSFGSGLNIKEKIIIFAMVVSAFCLVVSFLVLIASLPIYFFLTTKSARSKQASL